ncbi:MAG TPA: glycoside hydrolase family 15 protein [Solirubrobacterales bacterium]|nr:glycoside hydrolase family 15 protein [Solirubrobacterales bacterium]
MSDRGPVLAPHALRDYALLADGERGVLVGPRGDFAWMCFPRWHDDAVFSALIGGRACYALSPCGRFVWGGHYEDGLIWRSRWVTEDDAIVECREALALPARGDRAILLRRAIAIAGEARLSVALAAGAGFDHHGMARLHRRDDGVWTASLGEERMRWFGAAAASPGEDGVNGPSLAFELRLAEGEHHDLVLVLDHGGEASEPPAAERLWEATEAAWAERLSGFPDEGGLAARDVRHAYAVMSGLTSATGAMVAAATTSLPERADRARNYDYRYAWIRDQAYAGEAVAAAGPCPLLDDAVRFVAGRLLADGPDLMPAYTVAGDPVPTESRLPLPGYPGSVDVVGNRVRGQFQLDAFGEALLLFAAAARHDRLDADSWRAAEAAAAAIEARHGEADAGIWELEAAHWTHSRLICAAGLRAIAAGAPGRERGPRWLALADELVAAAGAEGVARDGHWRRTPDDDRVDAALLLAQIRGAVPVDDPRSGATLEAVRAELVEDGYCYRFRAEGMPLGEAEGAFLVCGFWLAMALAQRGETDRALAIFERNRAACGTPGLFAEEFDVRQRQLRGNLPQAFVHALLLESAVRLSNPPG